ncbi:hypothetical protein CMO86_06830, partial [Candidatus Woesearchaeota archaeon]|nr:hypothetical protein [Candidatus Woesearchaeota archaeon]
NLDVIGVVKGQDLKVTGVSSQTGYEGFLRADHQIEENTQLNFGQGVNSSLSGEIIVGTGQTVTINEVDKETAGVGNGQNEWRDLNGKVSFSLEGNASWNGSSIVLNGSPDFLYQRGGDVDGFTFGGSDFAIEQWVYITTTGQQHFYEARGGSNTNTILIYVGTDTVLKTYINGSNTITDSGALTQNVWHHIVLTRSGSTTTLYKNGTSVGSFSDSYNYVASPQGIIYFGANGGTDGLGSGRGSFLTGRIGITRTYKGRALTAAEITQNYNAGHIATASVVTPTIDLNPNVPASYPGTVNTVETTDVNVAGGSQVECMKVYNTFTPPSGGTNQRPSKPKPGQLYYNYDFKTIEFHDGYGWRQVDNTTRSGRVVFVGGNVPGSPTSPTSRRMDYLNLSTLGNSMYFGDIASPLGARRQTGGCSSSTRGIFMGGQGNGSNLNEIGYLTIASQGDAVDFGNLSAQRQTCQTLSSSTRGISYGAGEPAVNVIEYIEISTTGNSINFGESAKSRRDGFSLASSTRGISGGGTGGTNAESLIEYITISSLGDGTEFGNLTQRGRGQRSFSNSVRGIINGGYDSASPYARSSRIQYITMASTGNASYFGELTSAFAAGSSGTQSNHIRGVFAGGTTPTAVNNIDYITIATAGNALDFGDLSVESWSQSGACSDSHGGLGGF